MSKRTDISEQIRKYLNGELDGGAMHQLEREAQNDPFLMEALEGFEQAQPDQQQNLANLHARLQNRIGKKERRIIPWRTISIAASILLVLTIGGIRLLNRQFVTSSQRLVHVDKVRPKAKAIKSASEPASTIKSTNDTGKQINYASILKHKKEKPKDLAPSADADIAPASNGYAAINETTTDKKINPIIDTAKVSKVNANQLANNSLSRTKIVDTRTDLTGRVAGVQVYPLAATAVTGIVIAKDDGLPIPGVTVKVKGTSLITQTGSNGKFKFNSVPQGAVLEFASIGYEHRDLVGKDSLAVVMETAPGTLGEVVVTGALGIKRENKSVGYSATAIDSKDLSQKNTSIIKGIVTSKDDGSPLPGATVKIRGTNIATQTNANGQFNISAPKGATLEFGFIGYNSKFVAVNKDSLNVNLQPAGGSLSEVVVIGHETSKKKGNQLTTPENFNQYLNNNAKSPDGKTGTVKLSFVVDTDNSLSDFKIIRSISAQTDSAAIALVKNGPRWSANADEKPRKVKLKIKFTGK